MEIGITCLIKLVTFIDNSEPLMIVAEGGLMVSEQVKWTTPSSRITKDNQKLFYTQQLKLSTKWHGVKKLATQFFFLRDIQCFFFAFVKQVSSKIKSAQLLLQTE